jgi:hypothetical protein
MLGAMTHQEARVSSMSNFRIVSSMLGLFAASAVASAAGPSCPPIAGADPHPTFDAQLLKEGRFTYRTTLRGKSLGETIIEIRRAGAHFLITMEAREIAQSWKAEFERSFAPLSASLSMRGKKGPYSMKLRYDGTKITGEESEGGATRPVNATAEGVVIDQRVDWASMMAIRAPAEGSIATHVFDPSTGASEMLGKIGGTQPMSGAWGDATALRLDYTICKRDRLEEYTVYATRETPRYMLREDMPNGLVSELIRVEP